MHNLFQSSGKVLLDKIPTARTVVNKLDVIDSTFRNFEMEVLAGDGDFVTLTKENGLSYKLDFSKVYWNPRLGEQLNMSPLRITTLNYILNQPFVYSTKCHTAIECRNRLLV